jgi:hypothetical protein
MNKSFRCPITSEVITDPVGSLEMTADGHTYERRKIESWSKFGGSVTSITITSRGSRYINPHYRFYRRRNRSF